MRLVVLLCILVLSACTVNKLYYVPTKMPASTKKAKLVDHETNDTTLILYGDNYQPFFLNTKKEERSYGYTVKSHVYKSASGNLLNAWMITPKNTTPTATILFLHGNAGNILWQYQGIIPLVNRGFRVFVVDYSGFGFSTGKATRTNVLKDATSSLDYLKALPEIDNDKIIVYGQSLGGHLSAVLAQQQESKIDALVIEGAFSSHKDIAADMAGFIGRWVVKEKYSATKSIKNYHKPLLVIHSTEDKTIPFFMGKKIYDNGNSPKSFYEIKKCHICGPVYYGDSIAFKINAMIK